MSKTADAGIEEQQRQANTPTLRVQSIVRTKKEKRTPPNDGRVYFDVDSRKDWMTGDRYANDQ
jgi:hypothetical protein